MTWFPITDLSREDDIRMRRRRALMLVSCIVFVPWLMWGDNHARRSVSRAGTAPFRMVVSTEPHGGTETRRITASALRIDLPCADTVTIEPDPTLIGQALLFAPAGAQISVSGGSITSSRACQDDAPVTIRTSNVMPLELVQSGENTLRAGSFDGPVSVNSTGSGSVSIESAGTLAIQGHRGGDVTVGRVVGPLKATMMGSGDLRVGGGTVPVLDLVSRGSGDLMLNDVQALGGRVALNGSGDLRLGGAAGTFAAETDGSGTIQIHAVTIDHLTLSGTGSGDISIGGGRIETLQANRQGSGDLRIEASIGGGTLTQGGSGTVEVPNGGGLTRDR